MLRLLIQNLPRYGSDSSLRWWTARAHATTGDEDAARALYWRAFAHAISVGRVLEAVASLRELERLDTDTEHGWDQLFGELAARGFARPGPTVPVSDGQPDLDASRPDLPEADLLGVAAELARQSTPAEAGGARFRAVPWLADLSDEVVRWLLLRLDLQILAADEPLAVWTAGLPAFTLGGAYDTRGGRMAPPAGAMLWSSEDDGLSADGPALLLLVRASEVQAVNEHAAISLSLQSLRRRRHALRALTQAPWWAHIDESRHPAWLQALTLSRLREGQAVAEVIDADAAFFSVDGRIYVEESNDARTPLDAGQLVLLSRLGGAAAVARMDVDVAWFDGASVERLQRLDPGVFDAERSRLSADRASVQNANSSMIELLDEDLETGAADSGRDDVPRRSASHEGPATDGTEQDDESPSETPPAEPSFPTPASHEEEELPTNPDRSAEEVRDEA